MVLINTPAFASILLPTPTPPPTPPRTRCTVPPQSKLANLINASSQTNLRQNELPNFSTPKEITIASLVLLMHLMVAISLLQFAPQRHQVDRSAASIVSVTIELPSLVLSPPSISLSRPTASKKLIDAIEKTASSLVPTVAQFKPSKADATPPALNQLSAIDTSTEVAASAVASVESSGLNILPDAPTLAASQQTLLASTLPIFDASYLNNPNAIYPPLSKKLGEEGRVLLHVLVSDAGRAERVTLYVSSGFTRLDMAALEAVKRWQFRPAKLGDKAVSGVVIVPINFQLS